MPAHKTSVEHWMSGYKGMAYRIYWTVSHQSSMGSWREFKIVVHWKYVYVLQVLALRIKQFMCIMVVVPVLCSSAMWIHLASTLVMWKVTKNVHKTQPTYKRLYSKTCLETTAMWGHLSWRTTCAWQKVASYNTIEPATKDHLSWGTTVFYGKQGGLRLFTDRFYRMGYHKKT